MPELSEFNIIERYFAPLAGPPGLALQDDAACFSPAPGDDLVISKDLLVAERHFFGDDRPQDIAFKAVSVNVSDLAAKGSKPKYYLLGLCLPKSRAEHNWLKNFTEGLADAQNTYGISLIGGDTVSTDGPLSISITAMGYVAKGAMITRAGAKVGDDIYVSGSLGDAALGLKAINSGRGQCDAFLKRYHRPQARQLLGSRLVGVASAAADVSDGLLADMQHICTASGVGARILQENVPLSDDAASSVENDSSLWPVVLSGGDDYEILFTAPSHNAAQIADLSQSLQLKITRIGTVRKDASLELVDCNGELRQVAAKGFQHF